MTAAEWWAQPYAPEGGMAGTGIKQQIQSSQMDPHEVLVREAAQNSWDATIDSSAPVAFNISFRRLGRHAEAWAEFAGLETRLGGACPSVTELTEDAWILIIGDRGTSGLGGPLFADDPVEPGEPNDFVQFLRNVGNTRDTELGGGTYGFGKGIFYQISDCATIIVDTKCNGHSHPRRLMGAALGEEYPAEDGVKRTGRHWLGVRDAAKHRGVPAPLCDDAAETASEALGLPGFASDETGTDVVVLLPRVLSLADPESGEPSPAPERPGLDDIRRTAQRMADAVLWHLWPHLGSSKRAATMKVSIDVEGKKVKVVRPERHRVIQLFADALDLIGDESAGYDVKRSPSVPDPGTVGRLIPIDCDANVCRRIPKKEFIPAQLTSPIHHVARMRQARLVVDYVPGPEPSDPDTGYAAVFLASEKYDEVFAHAEPPTHETWSLQKDERTKRMIKYVNMRIHQLLRDQYAPANSSPSSDAANAGFVAKVLTGIVPTRFGSGASTIRSRGGGSSRDGRKAPVGRLLEDPRLVADGPHVHYEAPVSIPDGENRDFTLRAIPSVILENGKKEGQRPAGAPVPEIIGWSLPSGEEITDADSIAGDSLPDDVDHVIVRISHHADMVIDIDIKTERE
ncbi:hypothetical protein [Corynebacterium sp. 335C]